MQFSRFFAALIGLAVLLSACAPAAAPAQAPTKQAGAPAGAATAAPPTAAPVGQPKKGGVLHIMTAGDADLWDPHQTTSRNNEMWSFVTNTLLHVTDKNQELEPVLAAAWKYQDDKTLNITLRKGVKFHNKAPVNGRELKADDVIYSFNRILKGKPSPRSGQFEPVDAIKAIDDYTLQVTFKQPFAPFIYYLGDSLNVIVPKEAIEKFGDFNKPENAIGTGPFVMKDYVPDVAGTMTRNNEYFLPGQPYLDGAQFLTVKDKSTMIALYRTGKLELGTGSRGGLTGEEKAVLERSNPNMKFVPQPSAFVYELLMNLKREPFTDLRVRKAFHLATDRQAMLQGVLGGSGDVSGPLSPALFPKEAIPREELLKMPGFRQPKDEDIAEAKRLLAEAGHASGLSLRGEGTERIPLYNLRPLELAVSQLAKINVKVQIDVQDNTPFRKAETDKTFLFRARVHGTSIEPDDKLYTLFHTKGARNYGNFSDPEVDRLIEEQRRTLDAGKRTEIILQAQRRIIEVVPRIFLFSGNDFAVLQAWVNTDYLPGPRNYFGRPDSIWLSK